MVTKTSLTQLVLQLDINFILLNATQLIKMPIGYGSDLASKVKKCLSMKLLYFKGYLKNTC